MDLRRLKTFVAVADHGTVSKAAQVLRITQPALSRQIGGLEQECGFKLFERTKRRLVLTPRGELFLGDARSLLTCATTLEERAQSLRSGDIRVLKIVASALTIGAVFPEFLKRHAQHIPDVQLVLIEADAAEHLNMLENGDAHLAINVIDVLQGYDHRFESHRLPQFQMLATCSPSYNIGHGETIDIGQLANHPLLLLDPSFATRNVFDAACCLAGVRPNVFLECCSPHALVALAEAGHGVAVIPSIMRIDSKNFRVLRIMHRQKPLNLTLAVLWDKRRTLPRYAEGFAELLAEHLREVAPILKPSSARAAAAIRRISLRKSRSGAGSLSSSA